MEGIFPILQFLALALIWKLVIDYIHYLTSLPFGGCCTMYYSRDPNFFCPPPPRCNTCSY